MRNHFHIGAATIPSMSFDTLYSKSTITSSYLLVTDSPVTIDPLPATLVQIAADENSPSRLLLDTCNNVNAFGSSIRGRRLRGTYPSPTAIQNGDTLLQVTSDGYDGKVFSSNNTAVSFRAAENWTTASHASLVEFRTTEVGNISASVVLTISPQGITIGTFSGSLQGTSSYAISASWSPINGSGLATGSDYPITASWADNVVSSSFSQTASYVLSTLISISSSYATTASMAVSASYLIYPSQIVTVNAGSTGSLLVITASTYNSVFMSYILNDFQNFRAGNVVVLYTTSSTVWTETCTSDIGNSDNLKLSASLSASFLTVYAVNSGTTNYNVKYHYDLM